MKNRNYTLFKQKLACVFITVLFLACNITRGQESANNQAANPSAGQAQLQIQLIRDRMADYTAILDAEYRERIAKWDDLFLDVRHSAVTSAVQEIVISANRIRKARGLDATQLKDDAEFQQLLARKITGVLNADEMKSNLATWAKDVELVTRTRMIECFQQIIAEDLGRSFDENLSNQVVKAVRAIPVDVLVAQADSSAKIEQAILSSLPESALSAATRKSISKNASYLAQDAAFVWTGVHAPLVAPLVAVAAREVTRKAGEAALLALNERLTKDPDPNLISANFEQALKDWNAQNLDPRLEKILSDFRHRVIEHVEDQARKQTVVVLP